MLEIRHFRLIKALADEGGPTRAAARLHLTQSAVSHQLIELESKLGVPLFSRTRKQLQLTPAGVALLEASNRLLAEVDEVERSLQRGGRRRRVLRLCLESFTTYQWLPAVAAELARHDELVELRIVLEARRDPMLALVQGKLDLAIVSSRARDQQLARVHLGDDEWQIVMPPTHPLAKKSWVSPLDFSGQTLFAHDGTRSDAERLRELMSAEQVPLRAVSTVPLTETLIGLVTAGLGLGVVSQWAAAPFVARGEVVGRRLTRAGMHETWSAVYQHNQAEALPLAHTAELIRAHFRG